MNIYALKGHKVKCKRLDGSVYSNIEIAQKYLELGKDYTVEKTEVDRSYTFVYLQEFPNIQFSAGYFEDISKQSDEDDKQHPDFMRYNMWAHPLRVSINEICCYSIEDAVLAEKSGADRIEFCFGRELDGISPSRESIIEVLKQIEIPIYIMVRPRGGNFIYNDAEIKQMCDEMEWAAKAGVSGFVFGLLDANNKIDIENCKKLKAAAKKKPCVFHRAFDLIEDKKEGIEILSQLKFERILTSGGIGLAEDYISTLCDLIEYAGNKIIIMPGGGIRPHNVMQILKETGAKEIHTSDSEILYYMFNFDLYDKS